LHLSLKKGRRRKKQLLKKSLLKTNPLKKSKHPRQNLNILSWRKNSLKKRNHLKRRKASRVNPKKRSL
jgi:hypothetical protein